MPNLAPDLCWQVIFETLFPVSEAVLSGKMRQQYNTNVIIYLRHLCKVTKTKLSKRRGVVLVFYYLVYKV